MALPSTQRWVSAGGVVLPSLHPDERNLVYIRKPSNNFGGKKWTLPKGRVDQGESQKQAALREVKEEIGLTAKLVSGGYLGKYKGDFSDTHYYVMFQTGGNTKNHDAETERVILVTIDYAIQVMTAVRNKRDAMVLIKAKKFIDSLPEGAHKRRFKKKGDV